MSAPPPGPNDAPRSRAARTVLVPGLIAGVAAAIANSIVYAIASAAGASLSASFGSGAIEVLPFMPAVASFFPLAIAAVVAWLIVRAAPGARRPLAWIGFAVGIVSALIPLLAADGVDSALGLAAMHVIAGVAWVVAIGRR